MEEEMLENLKQMVQRAIKGGASELPRDPAPIASVGVDQRMSKAFTPAGVGGVSKSINPDMTGVTPTRATFIDEGGDRGDRSAVPGDPTMLRPPSLVQPGQSAADLHLRMVEQDLNVAQGAVLAAQFPPASSSGQTSADGTSFDAGLISSGIDAAADAVKAVADEALTNLRRIEQDLDVTRGTNLDLPQPASDARPTEY